MEYPWDELSRRRQIRRHIIRQQRRLRVQTWRNVILWLPKKLFLVMSQAINSCSTGDCCDGSTTCCVECVDSCAEGCINCPKNTWSCLSSTQCWMITAMTAASILFWTLFIVFTESLSRPGGIPTFPGCAARVDTAQTILFQQEIYVDQRGYWGLLANITTNASLCGTGFEGNSDVYGLGVRIGIYLQWASSLIANQTMAEERGGLAQANLLFLLAICVAVLVMTFNNACNFSIEIIIMYYMFFGSYFCVYMWPNLHTKKTEVKWAGPTLTRVILMLLYLMMLAHASWFWTRGYDAGFARSPCGTYHFLFVKANDADFFLVRIILAIMVICGAVEIALILPVFVMIFAEEFGRSVRQSDIYRGIFLKSGYQALPMTENTTERSPGRRFSILSRWRSCIRERYFDRVTRFMGIFREPVILSPAGRRRNQFLIGTIGGITFAWSVLAIELILKWNRISGVYAVDSTGQYIPLVMGIGGFIQLFYGFLKVIMRPDDEDDYKSSDQTGVKEHELRDVEDPQESDGNEAEKSVQTTREGELDLGDFHLAAT